MIIKSAFESVCRSAWPIFLCLSLQLSPLGLGDRTLMACDVPVFRYALERWPVDPYRVIAVETTPFKPSEKRALEKLRAQIQAEKLNLQLQIMKGKSFFESPEGRMIEEDEGQNQLFLFYPVVSGLTSSPWKAPISNSAVSQLSGCERRLIPSINSRAAFLSRLDLTWR